MSPHRTRENDTSKTRRLILARGGQALAAHGLEELTISGLARALGMSHANIYRHFRSRDDLILQIADEWMREMRTRCERAASAEGSAEDRLTRLVEAVRNQVLERAKHPEAMTIHEFVLRQRPEDVRKHYAHRRDLVAEIIAGGRNVSATVRADADALIDALQAFTNPRLIYASDDHSVEKRIRRVVQILLQGIGRRDTSASRRPKRRR